MPSSLYKPTSRQYTAIARPAETSHQGRLDYSRRAPLPWPESLDLKWDVNRMVARPGFYDYARASDRADSVEWHVNFADPSLFVPRVRAPYGRHRFSRGRTRVGPVARIGLSDRDPLGVLGLRRRLTATACS